MDVLTINKVGSYQQLNPIQLIKQLAESRYEGCLKISQQKVSYLIYFSEGKINYATHSVDPFERLDLHLRRLSNINPNVTSALRAQTRLEFEHPEKSNDIQMPQEYEGICWLISQGYITKEEAKSLVKSLIEEVVEMYLLLTNYTYEISEISALAQVCSIDALTMVPERLSHVKHWQSLAPAITSPYQRPYCHSVSLLQEALPDTYQKLSKVLIGFSFRQMAVLLKQDELKLAQSLHSLIVKGAIKLREAQPPFDQLPKFEPVRSATNRTATASKPVEAKPEPVGNIDLVGSVKLTETKGKIACVDDSPTILKEINRFLEGNNLEIISINDSVKALIEIMRFKPDLILLDVGMPSVDGYQLCRLIRNSSMFKSTPIVMVTGNNSLIDRAKARISGATDYLTKPFTQPELLKIVFRYLT